MKQNLLSKKKAKALVEALQDNLPPHNASLYCNIPLYKSIDGYNVLKNFEYYIRKYEPDSAVLMNNYKSEWVKPSKKPWKIPAMERSIDVKQDLLSKRLEEMGERYD